MTDPEKLEHVLRLCEGAAVVLHNIADRLGDGDDVDPEAEVRKIASRLVRETMRVRGTDAELAAALGIDPAGWDREDVIPAKCGKCGRGFLGRDAIRAPSIDCCRCWRCHGRLVLHPNYPDHKDARTRRRLKEGRLF